MVLTRNRRAKKEKWTGCNWIVFNGVFTINHVKGLQSRDPDLKILHPRLLGSKRGPVSAPVQTSNILKAICRLMKLLQSAGFAAGAFDAQMLMECDLFPFIRPRRFLFTKMI